MKVISIEKVNELVEYSIGYGHSYGTCRALVEAEYRIRILTDGGTIATRYEIGSEACLEERTLEDYVANIDKVRLVDPIDMTIGENEVVSWVVNETLAGGNAIFEAITHVVSLLAKHGLWEPPMYQWVEKAYEELKKQN